jgi:dihydroorotase
MNASDLIISGGQVWTSSGLVRADICIRGGKIAALGSPQFFASVREVLDVRGKIIIPGLIDTHTHQRDPGFTHKEDITTATQAAAAGGVTVSVGMPNVDPPVNAEGCLAFKVFMIRDTKRNYPHMPGIGVHHQGELLRIFEAVGETCLPLMVHPHSQEIMEIIEQRYWAAGETTPEAYARAHNEYGGLIWNTAVAILLQLQEATGTPLHILHVKTRGVVDMIRRAKDQGRPVTCEINPHSLFLRPEDQKRLGPYSLGSWVPEEYVPFLWEAIRDGTIDLVGSDHTPHTKEEKEIGWQDMWRAPGGSPQIQDYLSLFLTAVNEGMISLDQVVRVAALNPAKIFGLYPRKGVIEVGADADLVVIDINKEDEIRNEAAYAKCGWTPYDGRKIKGAPVCTLVRGQIVMKDGKVLGEPGHGRWAEPVNR